MIPVRDSVAVREPAFVTWALIGVCVAVFLFQVSLPPRAAEAFVRLYGLVPARYADPAWALAAGLPPDDWLPVLTHMFLHGGWAHLLLNMWTLWLFGAAVEDRLGHLRYLAFYLACGLAAGLAHAVVNAHSAVPAVGASGAIAGVLGAYARLFPRAWLILMVPVLFLPVFFPVPAMTYVAVWFALQLLQGTAAALLPGEGGVAWWAHIGGFLAGLLLVPLLRRPAPRRRPLYADEGVLGFGPHGQR
ncbi:rhomboid family intramembrane serine protease [Caldovatus sediminis]|uniref:Rhomboid family intramembrane serine protease n=1 Tax=Caldovatus sediminis TaxID=2041189 RepID=A0A8J3ECB4_9PROT|nr:rhomboid family intramembrane serine protease [Caldovatus sediminis]GGG34004.1 rhomboid family intramembrane serine protease [Caldovatus sediminis]